MVENINSIGNDKYSFDNHQDEYMVLISTVDCIVIANESEFTIQSTVQVNLVEGINTLTCETNSITVQYIKDDDSDSESSDTLTPSFNFKKEVFSINGVLTSEKNSLNSELNIPNLNTIVYDNEILAQYLLVIDKSQKKCGRNKM